MNIPKRLIGRVVEIHWMDPNAGSGPLDRLKTGRSALATWRELGVLHDITDGVVLIVHSFAAPPGKPISEPDEVQLSAIHEALIEKVTVFQEEPTT